MANQENKGKGETFILRGNADVVMRQLVDEYNSSNGWSVNRIVNNILNFTVVLERNTEQGVSKDTSKATTNEKVTKADATDATIKADDVNTSGTTQVPTERVATDTSVDASEEPVEAVKASVKPSRKAKSQS